VSYKDYYDVLGVGREASSSEIQKRFRSLAKKYHPDVSKEADAEERFKEIGEAYEVLKDDEKRSLYDKWGPHWRAISEGRQPPSNGPGSSEMHFDFGGMGYDPNTDLKSVFEQIFGGVGPNRKRGRRSRRNDQETEFELSVAEAYKGGRREIHFAEAGTGQQRRLKVTVPAQIRDGQKIRLSGQAAGGRGDLYLRIKLASDATFRVEGSDVYVALRISPTEAALGTAAPLETLDGGVKVRVPPGSSTGRQIRLRGRGYPKKGGQRGDLYAEIQVVVPKTLSDKERDLYERLAAASTFDPRER